MEIFYKNKIYKKTNHKFILFRHMYGLKSQASVIIASTTKMAYIESNFYSSYSLDINNLFSTKYL